MNTLKLLISFSFVFILSTLLLTNLTYAQKVITIEKGCSYYEEVEGSQVYVKKCENLKILKIINDILSIVSIQSNFNVYEASIDNAVATNYNNERLLIIDPEFLKFIETETKDKYTSYLIIAHEIGHHLNAHISESKNRSPWWDELEADQFAGGVIQKLGITTATVNNVINLIAPDFSRSKTHPDWQARMKACINGYGQSFFLEKKRNVVYNIKNRDLVITEKTTQLENYLNSLIYNKVNWLRNIKYKVSKGYIYMFYETSFYNGKDQSVFIKKIDTINIQNISKIYLRWHDPGEIAFETSPIKHQTLSDEAWSKTKKIHTLKGKSAVKHLNSSSWFMDNEITISDDLSILLKLYEYVAILQRLYES